MTAGQRKAYELAKNVCARIDEICAASPGLAAWQPQLAAVNAADATMTEALRALMKHDGGMGIGNVQRAAVHACDVLVKEWERASARYIAKGSPAPPAEATCGS